MATQLVEAGVDLDFPVVSGRRLAWKPGASCRALQSRDAVARPGRFIVFRAPSEPPAKSLRRGLHEALDFFRKGLPDLNDPDIFPKYMKQLMSTLGQDENDTQAVLGYERQLDFPKVAERFRMIEDSGTPV